MVPEPDSAELLAEATKPSLEPDPDTRMICPSAIVLSGWAEGTFGHVNASPSALTVAPGVKPAAARPCAENVVPSPSNPSNPELGFVSLLSVIPVLSKLAASEPNGTSSCAVPSSDWVCPPAWNVACATRSTGPGVDVPDAGAVTLNFAEAVAPGPPVPAGSAPLGVTVHPDGTSRLIAPSRSGESPGLSSVACTVNA